MDNGWIKLHRKMLDNPLMGRPAYRSVWIELLLRATHNGTDVMFEGKRVRLEPGQFTTGTLALSKATGVPRGTVVRILETFKNEHQIEQRTDRQCSMITILKWKQYQADEQRNGQRVGNEWATSEQRVDTKQECNNEKNERMKEEIQSDSEALAIAPANPSPSEIARSFFDPEMDRAGLITSLSAKGVPEDVATREIAKFISYWTEPTASGKKQRWQTEKTFEVRRRLLTWFGNVRGYQKNQETKGIVI